MSVEFCSCGSIVNDGECTNHNCINFVGHTEPATLEQIELIKKLQEEVEDYDEIDFSSLTYNQALIMIQELVMIKEFGEE